MLNEEPDYSSLLLVACLGQDYHLHRLYSSGLLYLPGHLEDYGREDHALGFAVIASPLLSMAVHFSAGRRVRSSRRWANRALAAVLSSVSGI